MGEELDLNVTFIRDAIHAMDRQPQPQKMYALIEAAPTGVHVDSVQMPLNLSLVLDRSASMRGDKITNLRRAVHALIDLLQPTDYISLVLFDEVAETPLDAQLAADKVQLHAIVDGIQERGGTQLSLGLEKGLEEIARNHDPNRINKIILLTDGNSWGDEDKCLELARQAGQRGVPIVALGLGLSPASAPETTILGGRLESRAPGSSRALERREQRSDRRARQDRGDVSGRGENRSGDRRLQRGIAAARPGRCSPAPGVASAASHSESVIPCHLRA